MRCVPEELVAKSPKNRQRRSLSPRQAVLKVVKQLHNANYEALLAGGCVRDMLLRQNPHDYDVATNATPEAVTQLFPRTLTVGAQFGVVVVLLGARQVEVATFRSESVYTDGRRPDNVVFTDARHDAERRDFTINGMFFDPLGEQVIDYVGGQADLAAGIVRAIGSADERFAEDHLRMLRAVRFACRLGFEIAEDTWQAVRKHAPKISRISRERIAGELERILADPNRSRGVRLAIDSGLLRHILPRVTQQQLECGLAVLTQLPQRVSYALALAALLVECEAAEVSTICRDLRSSNELRKHTTWLVENRPVLLDTIPLSRGRLKRWLSRPLFDSLLQLIKAWLRSNGQPETVLRKLRLQIHELGDEPISPPRLLDGHALIHLGATSGPVVGQLIEELYLAQLENEVTTKEQARAWARDWLGRHN